MGVCRIYYENNVRTVEVAQHTTNGKFTVSDKVSLWGSSGWVVLLKMSTNIASYSNKSISASMNQFLGNTKFSDIASSVSNNTCTLGSLSSDQLAAMIDTLHDAPCETSVEDSRKWELVTYISNILDSRYDKMVETFGEDIIPKTIVTKEILIRFIEDYIQLRKIDLQLQTETDESKLTQDPSTINHQNGDSFAIIEQLESFLEEVKLKANDENAYDYWLTYWNMRNEPIPSNYCEK